MCFRLVWDLVGILIPTWFLGQPVVCRVESVPKGYILLPPLCMCLCLYLLAKIHVSETLCVKPEVIVQFNS